MSIINTYSSVDFTVYVNAVHHVVQKQDFLYGRLIRINDTATSTFDIIYQILVNKVREITQVI